MKRRRLAAAAAAALALSAFALPRAAGAAPLDLKVERHVLSNGMVVLTHEDHSIPMVSVHVFYRVGSRNERPGITGVSHLFEHMMFNGSAKYKPKELDKIVENAGGGANAYTTNDVTAYAETVTRDALPAVLDIEADRMRALTLTTQNIEQERGIVAEERRVSTDNDPAGAMNEQLFASAFLAYPYHWSVIGWMGDIQTVTLEEAKRYFQTYYGPNNATLVVAGDFDPAKVMGQIEATMGKVLKRGTIVPVVDSEPEQTGERRVDLVHEAALPMVMAGYKIPPVAHKDIPALRVLEAILGSGESSRLFRKMVYTGLAADAEAACDARIGPSLFVFQVQAQEDKTAEECEKALYAILRDVQDNGVTDAELAKAKNQIRASLLRSLETIDEKANQIGSYDTFYGDYRALLNFPDQVDAVTRDDVKRAAAQYFTKRTRTVVTLVQPKGDKEADHAEN